MGWNESVPSGVKEVASCSVDTLFFAMISDIFFLVVSAISGNKERLPEAADLSTSFLLFFVFYFGGILNLILDSGVLLGFC
jgi:hypothetical protein